MRRRVRLGLGACGGAAAQVRRVPEGHGGAGVPRHRGQPAGRTSGAGGASRERDHR